MKVERVSEHIWSAAISLILFPVRVWLVKDCEHDEGVTLVDAGIPTMAGGILRAIEHLGLGPLRRIVLTHGHADHVGSINRIRKTLSIPVFAHGIEIPYLEGELPYPRRSRATSTVTPGLTQPLSADEAGRLTNIGDLTPHLAPGHAPGHVVYHHKTDDVLLAGDLFTSRGGRLKRPMPMFTGDMATAVESAQIVGVLKPKRLEVGHGGPVLDAADQLEGYLAKHRQAQVQEASAH